MIKIRLGLQLTIIIIVTFWINPFIFLVCKMLENSLKGRSVFPRAQKLGPFTVIEPWKSKQSKTTENIHIKKLESGDLNLI